jgi:chemosensory pili system protein ChpA (sensor histidine kinase/response regulator)
MPARLSSLHRAMPPQILVIDDSKAVRLIIKKVLTPYDCVVNEATNGFTGLFAMERTLPDLLLIDIAMPTMDGDEMLAMLKSNPQLSGIPVIMLISSTDNKVLPRITKLGVNAMLKKPFTEAVALETIRGVIKLKPAKKGA